MSGRLIVISNRIPLGGPGSGGLVVALHECLSEAGGLWIGSADTDASEASEDFTEHDEGLPYRKLTFELTQADQDEFYLGYANSVLWPLCHRRTDLISYEAQYREGYERVNERLAKMLVGMIEPGDLVWIHDYHFFSLAWHLRELGVENRIGFFLHIPFPNVSDLPALSDREVFAAWIAAHDVVGLQTQRDVAACREMFRIDCKAEFLDDCLVRYGSRTTDVRSFPIGIDVDVMREAARKHDAHTRLRLDPDEKLLIGVDRLDYSKGIPNRVEAFGAYLDSREKNAPRATLLQIAPPSREDVKAYREIRDELERLTGAINGEHSEIDWTPIRYIHRPIPREELAALFRRADVGLVTPLADGMNLVAKEYVAAQDPEDPGVLILSRFAGAAEQLPEALMVNPYDTEDMAMAIDRALTMPLEERRERQRAMFETISTYDIGWWSDAFLQVLAGEEGAAEAATSCDGIPGQNNTMS